MSDSVTTDTVRRREIECALVVITGVVLACAVVPLSVLAVGLLQPWWSYGLELAVIVAALLAAAMHARCAQEVTHAAV